VNDAAPIAQESTAMKSAPQKTIELSVTRSISAPPAEIYDAWLDAKRPGSPWFGVARAILHPVIDGLFYHLVEFEGHHWAHYGRFITLARPSRIEHSWVSEATRGLESHVALTFEPQGDFTLMTLRHSNLPDDEMGRRHEEGWGFVLGVLEEGFRQRAGDRP
jgi:uncharacterized protein YndB with AHSA1/START domain